jgi:lipoprotein-releasing system permease protein
VAGQIIGSGFLAKAEAVAPVSVTGVESGQVSAIARIGPSIVSGSTELTLGAILIGQGLADKLGVGVGQTVSLSSDRGVQQTFTVGGIFALGVGGLDNGSVIVNIRPARVLFALPEGLTRFEVKLDDLNSAPQAARAIGAATGLKATPWTENNKDLLDALRAQARTGDLIKIFALITIIIGVASALLLSTYRRQSEIGIMRAMGATRRFVVFVFVIQGALIGLSGGVIGAGLGYLSLLPFPLPEATAGGGLPVDVRQGDYLAAILLTVTGAVLAAIWPANSASRVDPVKVIGP